MKKYALLTAFVVTVSSLCLPASAAQQEGADCMQVTVNLDGTKKPISPYIYGINQYGNQDHYSEFTATALRQGGNRTTAYNWETNYSNAGADWHNSSDTNLSSSDRPADCAQVLSAEAAKQGIDYKLTTLQMAGYVAADKAGDVSEDEAAPSERWNKVEFKKDSPLSMTPDLDDGVVYMDEYVNYLVNTLGASDTKTGIQAYSLDNEPALWNSTHSLIHPQPVSMQELSEKSIALAGIVKNIDPNAEIFGPSLWGYIAYDHLADDDASDEWETIQAENNYHWFLDYYLDAMKQAEETGGRRLLDVLDIHYYSESSRVGAEDRLQSVRTLYEKGFVENSWIGEWCQANVPILPTVQASIDKYYPGTKLAISEYSFGGDNDISGTIAQAEALGCFADAGVYFASFWGGSCPYIYAGFNLYTNYDGKGAHFGDTLVEAKTEDVSKASAYASIDGDSDSVVKLMLTNKSFTDAQTAEISLENTDTAYQAAAVYAVCSDSEDVVLLDIVKDVADNKLQVTLPALSAAMIVVSDNAADFDGLVLSKDQPTTEREVVFENIDDYINADGHIEIPLDDPTKLKEIILTGDVTSSAGSTWATVGGAVCMNAVDEDGNPFWTSKGFSLALGTGLQAKIVFDGSFDNDGTPVNGTIAEKKFEVQRWWDASSAKEEERDDELTLTFSSIRVIYEVDPSAPGQSDTERGDVNCDGIISIADAVLLARYVAQDSLLAADAVSAIGRQNADVNRDDEVSADDISAISRFLAGFALPEV